MVKSIRKKHVIAWIILSIVLPPAIGKAIAVLKQITPLQMTAIESSNPLPVIVSSSKSAMFEVNLRRDESRNYQLEWVNKQPPEQPSAIIYKVKTGSSSIEEGIVVGRIETKPIYRFSYLPEPGETTQYIIIYDFIHSRILYRINLPI